MKKYTVNELRRAFISQGDQHFSMRNMKARGETIRWSYAVRMNENGDLFLVRYSGKLGFAVWYISESSDGKLHMNPLPDWHLYYHRLKKEYELKGMLNRNQKLI